VKEARQSFLHRKQKEAAWFDAASQPDERLADALFVPRAGHFS